jgi:Protein of unknown function (DUF4238)
VIVSIESNAQDQTKANHHYVTRAYLDNMLAPGETRLWVYQRNSNHVFRNIPKNLASARGYYTVVRNDGSKDDQFEKLLARDIEGPGVPILRKLSKGEKQLTLQEITHGASLIAMQELRVPFKRDQLSIMMTQIGESFLNTMMSAPGHVERTLQEMKDDGRIDQSVSASEMRKHYEDGDFVLKTTDAGNLAALGRTLGHLIGAYAAMKWTVLIRLYRRTILSVVTTLLLKLAQPAQ